MRQRFYAGNVKKKVFRYTGFKVEQNENDIVLDQSYYMYNLNSPVLDPRRIANKAEILKSEEQSL